METVIVICLLIVIVLLLQDKVVIKKRQEQKPTKEKTNPDLPDIMGQPKPLKRLSVPSPANERQIPESEIDPANLDIEYDENEEIGIQIPQEELDDVFTNVPDLEEEEEEWQGHGTVGNDDGLATGVTFEELSSAGMLLQKEKLEPTQKETAAAIVHKIQGTELFNLLENSMEGASRKIAELLDQNLSIENGSSSSTLRNDNVGDFDIGEFV
ncbi:conjugal transfer protein TraD [Galbibacter sp. EGI 63066]|uniref:conjugal transfer protein TraD n=1 Tax=Galbibacter sp. EGI 63066 TaxID=2993559 RepID=UPI002248EEC1|nr:conjugal transfer protein TraD [Galbibacter sp. EGI 63066]MCX2680768.1 conjugal transfer protein TraD [Galbibacter sp. EGI 63066]